MEHLFSINIVVNNEKVNYQVVFDKEKYVFDSGDSNNSFQNFSFEREHDEWHDQQLLPPEIKTQAIDALERYLLRQH